MKNQRILPYVVEVMDKPDGITAWAGLPSVVKERATQLKSELLCNAGAPG
jgi:hypothetical protein